MSTTWTFTWYFMLMLLYLEHTVSVNSVAYAAFSGSYPSVTYVKH